MHFILISFIKWTFKKVDIKSCRHLKREHKNERTLNLLTLYILSGFNGRAQMANHSGIQVI